LSIARTRVVPPFTPALSLQGGIENAMRLSNKYHEENVMQERLTKNPNDEEAKKYFAKKDKQKLIDEQYHHVMEEYPESFGRVLMLYVAAKINGHDIQAFCDSGAQSTIMSKRLAVECGLGDLIDERMSGTAVGVGTGKILGRIHIVQLQLGDYYFPCSVTVMDDPPPGASEMPFLLGLDMMKRHTASIDLAEHCLKFRIAPGKYMEAPFLHEKDLDKEQGGTKGFDAQKANAELLKLMEDEDGDKMDD
jgi:DNA damage-inducible protein 1